ncbi:MAG: hypothetical protein ACKOPT_06445 [Cyanobium sp.]
MANLLAKTAFSLIDGGLSKNLRQPPWLAGALEAVEGAGPVVSLRVRLVESMPRLLKVRLASAGLAASSVTTFCLPPRVV